MKTTFTYIKCSYEDYWIEEKHLVIYTASLDWMYEFIEWCDLYEVKPIIEYFFNDIPDSITLAENLGIN